MRVPGLRRHSGVVPLLDLLQAVLSELANEVQVGLLVSLPVFLLFLCEGIVWVHVPVSPHAGEDGPAWNEKYMLLITRVR